MMMTMSQHHGPYLHGLPDDEWQQQQHQHYSVHQSQPQQETAHPPVTVIPQPQGPADVKPRLTKQQHDVLEAHFRQCHKPSTSTKKNFAMHLGVPLEKVNNWFQNRRAKVKQDAKKQQNLSNMQLFQGMQAQQNFHVPHASLIYPPNGALGPQDVSPTAIPPDMQTQADAATVHGMPTSQEFGPPLQPISESTRPGSSENIMNSLYAAGYHVPSVAPPPMMPQGGHEMFHVQHERAQGEFHQGQHDRANFEASRLMGPFDSENNVMGNFGYDMNAYDCAGSSPEKTDSLVGTVSAGASPFSSSQAAPSTMPPTSEGDVMGSQSNPYGGWNDFAYDASGNDANMPQASQHLLVPGQEFSQHANMPSLDLPKDEQFDSNGFGSMDVPHSAPPTVTVYDRRNSSTSALTESMSAVGIQNQQQPAGVDFKQPAPPSSIALRRKGTRPAALNSIPLRSASYSAGMPTSPGAPHSDSDQTLRRIRSSGVTNGRVAKNTVGPAQRSPLSFTFAESAASPKFTRHSSFQLVTSPSGNESLAPPTPLTPNEMGQFPSWQNAGQPSTQAGTSDFSGAESFNPPSAYSVSVAGSIPNMSSPPSTPLDAAQLVQYRQQLANGPVYHNTPPQSAPPTQQSFARPQMQSQYAGAPGYLNPHEFPGMDCRESQVHMRRPSLPDTTFMHNGMHQMQSVPIVTAAGDIHMPYPLQDADQMQMMHEQYGPAPIGGFPHEALMVPVGLGAARPATSMPDLFVHEYTPPHVRGQTPPPRHNTGRKDYVFNHTGPEAFEKPEKKKEQDRP